jgi:hypothetical protein
MDLLIHADPGGRSGFIAAWLTNRLTKLEFDSGLSLHPKFIKIHNLIDPISIRNHPGLKIRVRPSLSTIDLHSLLFLRKNVHIQYPGFTKDEFSLETFTKLHHFSQEIMSWDHNLDYSLYDIVINFQDTFDNNYMIDLYRKVTNTSPSSDMIKMLIDTNNLNKINIDKNHSCSILKLCFEKEHQLGLKEEHRFWSIVDVYNTTSVNNLYDTVYKLIVPENYGILL